MVLPRPKRLHPFIEARVTDNINQSFLAAEEQAG